MAEAKPSGAPRFLASFGRRRGHKLRTTKQSLMDSILPRISITLPEQGALEVGQLFSGKKDVWLEVGFGGGEHLAHQAELYPEIGIIGCEPYVNGIAGLLTHVEEHGLGNVRVFTDDARLLCERLGDASIGRAFVLYPDPWPKKRHHKRRLVSKPFIDELARVMRPGAELRLATDHADYCTWMLEALLPHPAFAWQAKTCDDWLKPPADWISTRYEQKRLAGMPTYLNFVRV